MVCLKAGPILSYGAVQLDQHTSPYLCLVYSPFLVDERCEFWMCTIFFQAAPLNVALEVPSAKKDSKVVCVFLLRSFRLQMSLCGCLGASWYQDPSSCNPGLAKAGLVTIHILYISKG